MAILSVKINSGTIIIELSSFPKKGANVDPGYTEAINVLNSISETEMLFERIHPGFFIRLKEKARDITIAEQRMAALTRLNFTSRQMASMLGISVAVYSLKFLGCQVFVQ